MTQDFNQAELTLLSQAVDARRAIAMNELVHTDAREYRQYLRDLLTSLEQLQKKLPAVPTQPR